MVDETEEQAIYNNIYERDEAICVYCKEKFGNQIILVLEDGPTSRANKILICEECHVKVVEGLTTIEFLAIAFIHLTRKGENLKWAEKFENQMIEQALNIMRAVIRPSLILGMRGSIKKPLELNCPQCGVNFTTKRANTRFCSSGCRNRAWSNRNPRIRLSDFPEL